MTPQDNQGHSRNGYLLQWNVDSGRLSFCDSKFTSLDIGCPVTANSASFDSAQFGNTVTAEATFAIPLPVLPQPSPLLPAIKIIGGEVFCGSYNPSAKGQPNEFTVNLKLVETIVGLTQKVDQLQKEVANLQAEMIAVKKKIGL
jgi:hypothetical protein